MFYWTCYEQDGADVEFFQGKSVLMAHENNGGETQGTGFFGIKDNCRELGGRDIPECFRILTKDVQPVHGTSLTIAGFKATQNWRQNIAASVVENFFYAIQNGSLTVIIEPGDQSDLFEIEQVTLGDWFTTLLEDDIGPENADDEDESELKQAQAFWQLTKDAGPTAERQDIDFGHCRLWIQVGEGLPSKVALVRRTGMLITTAQKGLVRFPGFRDFVAMCVFEDPAGNELLRRMENTRHDQFEPDRLPDNERDRGDRALTRITRWIRGEIRKAAGPTGNARSTVLSELAVYLPDPQPEEPFDDAGQGSEEDREPGFGERVKLTLRPVRRPAPPALNVEDEQENDGDTDGDDTGTFGGAGTGEEGGENGTGGPGEGDGEGGTGPRGGGQPKVKRIPVSNVRILPIDRRENSYRLTFRADAGGIAMLGLEEAGDSSAIPRDDVRAVDSNVSLGRFPLVNGERMSVDITADTPIGGRSWRLTATDFNGEQQ